MAVNERIIILNGVPNFRDYGDYPLAGGGRLARNRLFRSSQHRDATPGDLTAIDALGLAAIIDLRGERERVSAPCRRGAAFAAELLFEPDETAGLAPHIAAAKQADDGAGAFQAMQDGYREMPFRPVLLRIVARYFDALARVDGPTLIHCAAGKDRTGLAVALLHTLMGVHRDDVIADYMLTNQAGLIEWMAAARGKTFGNKLSDAMVNAIMSVHPAYLDAAFAGIAERCGSVERYMRDMLGVTDTRRAAIAAQLTA